MRAWWTGGFERGGSWLGAVLFCGLRGFWGVFVTGLDNRWQWMAIVLAVI